MRQEVSHGKEEIPTIFGVVQEELWKNMEYPDVTLNMLTTDHEPSPEEKVRFDAWMMASLNAREFAWLEYRSRNVELFQWESEQAAIGLVLGCSRYRVAEHQLYPRRRTLS